MKKLFLRILIIPVFFIVSAVHGQRQLSDCKDSLIGRQVDSLKKIFAGDGFTLLKESFITMESEYEQPVVMPLTQGSWYHFVFIGEYSSNLYEVRVFDATDKQVIYQKKRWGDVDGNIIAFSYIPDLSQYYMFKPLQVNKKKKKNLCGYVMLWKKTENVTK